ncbi:MAG: hypothetical protein WEA77_13895 [Hyphomonas sp.]|uniref:hypothetical protein n=1 Tax=Hyphomonas sp. TaxID=87 RepID=UPI00349FEF5E
MSKSKDAPDSDREGRDSLLQLTVMVSGRSDPAEVLAYAVERGWLDADGNITPAGMELEKALSDQSGTRSAFRGT